MNETTKIWLCALAIFLLFGLVGKTDYADALEAENAALKLKAAQCQGNQVVWAGRE